MRLLAVTVLALLLLASVPLTAESAPLAIHRQSSSPGWMADRFSMTGDRATIVIESSGSEVFGHLLHLYDTSGKLLRGAPMVFTGGNNPNVVLATGATELGTDTMDARVAGGGGGITFICNAACNPSREFILVVSAAGKDLGPWGYGVFADGVSIHSQWAGARAGVLSTRQFEGTVAHTSVTPAIGVNVVQDGSHTVQALDKMTAFYGKFAGARPSRMTVDTPLGGRSCACALPAYPAGQYEFRYDDASASGDEGYLLWADIRLS